MEDSVMPCRIRVSVATTQRPGPKDVLAFLSAIQHVHASAWVNPGVNPEVPPMLAMQGELDVLKSLDELVAAQTAAIQEALRALEESPDSMNPSALLNLQFMINLFSQLLETSTNVLSAMNDAINAMWRNLNKAATPSAASDLRILAIDRDVLGVTLEGTSRESCDRLSRLGPEVEALLPSLFASLGASGVSVHLELLGR